MICPVLENLIQETGATVCGRTPIEILLAMIESGLFGQVTTKLVAYGTSTTDISKQTESIVTYSSFAILRSSSFTMQEKHELLRYARDILKHLFDQHEGKGVAEPNKMTPALRRLTGAFVTLYSNKNGKKTLRGCMGRIEATTPLYETVADMVRAATLTDLRFAPITAAGI